MPRPKSLKKTVKCLVCAGTTDSANLGLDVCRACTVFYRRSRHRKYVCRSLTDNCTIGEGVNCRKCRLRELELKLQGQPIRDLLAFVEPVKRKLEKQSRNLKEASQKYASNCSTSGVKPKNTPSTNGRALWLDPRKSTPSTNGTRSMLERLRNGYRAMCDARLTAELSSRVPPPHPMDVIEGTYDILPATYRSIDAANRIFLTALLQFGAVAFPGFVQLSRDDKWTIVANFFRRFRNFEAGYRAEQAFGQQMERTFAGFTMYFDGNMPANFFDGCDDVMDPTEAKRMMEEKFKRDYATVRIHLHSAQLRHDEFLAVLALMFWTTDGLPIDDGSARFGKNCRDAVLSELHGYFRDELGLDDYALRLGELLLLLQIFEQRSSCSSEYFEMLRLLNVFSEDSISYRVTRDGEA